MYANSFQKLGPRRGLFLVNFPGLLHRFGHIVVLNDDNMDIVDVTDFEEMWILFARKRAI